MTLRYQKLKDDLEIIEDAPMPYGALQVISAAFNILGWLVIIVHCLVTAVIIHPFIRGRFGEFLPTLLLSIFALFIGLLYGVSIIAVGQVIELMIDIRNDVRITRRYVRRFGYFFARSIEQDKQE